jgi:hypothetical protein
LPVKSGKSLEGSNLFEKNIVVAIETKDKVTAAYFILAGGYTLRAMWTHPELTHPELTHPKLTRPDVKKMRSSEEHQLCKPKSMYRL